MMPLVFLLSLMLAVFVGAGAITELLTQSRPEGLDYFFAACSGVLLILLGFNADKFFKDYSSCFPI